MGNSTSSQKISAQDRAILDMKNQRDNLHRYQKRITVLTERETEVARQCLAAGRRDKAQLALRRKKFQESLLAKADAQLDQLQRLTADVEFAALQKDVLYGLQQGTKVLKQIQAEMGGIDGVEKLLEDNAEARAYVDEVTEMLGGQLSRADEDEVDDELERLEAEASGEERVAIARDAAVDSLPNVPAGLESAQTKSKIKKEPQMIPA